MERPRPVDVLAAVALAALGAVELVVLDPPHLAAALAVEVAAALLLAVRRQSPLLVPTVAGVLVMLLPYIGPELDEPAAPILVLALASYTLARHLPDLRGLASMALFLLVILSDHLFTTDDPFDISDVVFVVSMLAPPYAFGLLLRSLAQRNERLAEQGRLLLRLQETVRADAVSAERARIARELHDVLAHSISAMVVQSAVAEDLVRGEPDRAAAVVADVAAIGRRALDETGRLLHLIRDEADEVGLAPDVGLERLDELVDQFRRSGLQVDLVVDGSLAALPAGVDLSAYRIVQEALTNALKHAGHKVAQVRVRRQRSALLIDAENPAVPGRSEGSGLGLVGMAERVSVFGGSLSHGFTGDGRFVLTATLPLPPVDP